MEDYYNPSSGYMFNIKNLAKVFSIARAKGLKFVDVTEQIKIEIPISGNNGIWADVDIDGDLDLYLTNEHGENKLYIQSPDRTFAEKSREFGVNNSDISQSASFADVDLDGYPDLYVCNWKSLDVFYRNIDGTHFKRINLPLIHLTKKWRSKKNEQGKAGKGLEI